MEGWRGSLPGGIAINHQRLSSLQLSRPCSPCARKSFNIPFPSFSGQGGIFQPRELLCFPRAPLWCRTHPWGYDSAAPAQAPARVQQAPQHLVEREKDSALGTARTGCCAVFSLLCIESLLCTMACLGARSPSGGKHTGGSISCRGQMTAGVGKGRLE